RIVVRLLASRTAVDRRVVGILAVGWVRLCSLRASVDHAWAAVVCLLRRLVVERLLSPVSVGRDIGSIIFIATTRVVRKRYASVGVAGRSVVRRWWLRIPLFAARCVRSAGKVAHPLSRTAARGIAIHVV